LIAERVKAGIENAQSKGVKIGRPRVKVDPQQMAALRKSGASWSQITEKTGISKGTAQRAFYALPKIDPDHFPRAI
jgi:DNA invertase Pin-like site-specific DNA recombinase